MTAVGCGEAKAVSQTNPMTSMIEKSLIICLFNSTRLFHLFCNIWLEIAIY